MAMTNELGRLSGFAVSFAIIAAILSAATAVLIHFLYDLGLRSFLHRVSINQWIRRQSKENVGLGLDPLGMLTDDPAGWRDLYILPHQQLCGQISTYVQSLGDPTDSKLALAIAPSIENSRDGVLDESEKPMTVQDELNEEDVSYSLERGIDKLQSHMGKSVRLCEYTLSLAIPFLLIGAFVLRTDTEIALVQYILLIVVAGALSPMWRALLERLLNRD